MGDKKYLINGEISYSMVKLATKDGVKEMSISEALSIASEHELDLVLVSEQTTPPICKLMDYDKYLYSLKKNKKKQKASTVKEIRLNYNIAQHDINIKINNAKKILNEGDKVKFTVVFKGRQMAYIATGVDTLNKIANDLTGVAKVVAAPRIEGRVCSMTVDRAV